MTSEIRHYGYIYIAAFSYENHMDTPTSFYKMILTTQCFENANQKYNMPGPSPAHTIVYKFLRYNNFHGFHGSVGPVELIYRMNEHKRREHVTLNQ